ncbi:MAG: transcriptional repressor [Sandaracinus sp.]|nr:transcriptional repressor [Sandaracinus sp.]
MESLSELLRAHGLSPTDKRLAIARYVLRTDDHPTAERVMAEVRRAHPEVSRATVYATLAAFEAHGLLRRVELGLGHVVLDPKVRSHHHWIDETGRVHDLPADSLRVEGLEALGVEDPQVEIVVRGRRAKS